MGPPPLAVLVVRVWRGGGGVGRERHRGGAAGHPVELHVPGCGCACAGVGVGLNATASTNPKWLYLRGLSEGWGANGTEGGRRDIQWNCTCPGLGVQALGLG